MVVRGALRCGWYCMRRAAAMRHPLFRDLGIACQRRSSPPTSFLPHSQACCRVDSCVDMGGGRDGMAHSVGFHSPYSWADGRSSIYRENN